MNGVGVFFNVMEDLERIVDLCQPTKEAPEGYIDWITPIMAPDQSSVQINRKLWAEWRRRIPKRVKFIPWIVCDDPVADAKAAEWITKNYEYDGMLFNAEKSYESAGKWKGLTLVEHVMQIPGVGARPKILSYPSTPAERFDMDYRAFERAGFWFAPQAYWLDPTINKEATPIGLYNSTLVPEQIHVGRDYLLKIEGVTEKHWGRVVQWYGGDYCLVKDMRSAKIYRCAVVPREEGSYKYMTIAQGRRLFDQKTGKVMKGKVLGFQNADKIVPTVGVYPNCYPTPEQVTIKLNEVPNLKGASLYLGETSTSQHVKAVWKAIQ